MSRITIPRIETDSDILPIDENRNLDDLPGNYGWPIIGNTLKLLNDPKGTQNEFFQKYGKVIRIDALFQRAVLLLGPEANELVMMDKDKNFSSRKGWEKILDRLFHNGLMLRDFEDHRAHRRIMNVAFKPEALKNYMAKMNPILEIGLSSWNEQKGFCFYPNIKKLTLDVAAVVFIGMELGEDAEKVNQAFVDTVAASLAVVRFPVPGLALWKGMKGREYLVKYFSSMIAEKRTSNDIDMFTQFCRNTNEEGQYYSDEDIVDHIIFLMMAAHDTTTSAITTMIYGLGKHPEWQTKLREQCDAVFAETGNAHLAFEDQDKLELVEWTFKEALRLYTPVPSIPRRSIRSFEFEGYTIPANTSVSVSPSFTHYMPEIWENPDEFEPDRFSSQRAEDKKHPFAWVPFNKGAHMCIGLHFAHMQVKAFIYQFLRSYEFELPKDYKLEMIQIPIPKPKDGLPILLKSRG
ncbi:MAG: cytochrome P450 [Candidatus Azotimanducaceae bacterium]|jgi:cytochrome P450